MKFDDYFEKISGRKPYSWQSELAKDSACQSRLIRIPTGFGKTWGVLAAWLWHRLGKSNNAWPRRLVWCLPMRVLVEQTAHEVRGALDTLGLLWNENESHEGAVGLHLLMGGADGGEWRLYPEECAVLIGTQDMLLSRALNRGYASPRARWPMEFGLLNQDSLWVLDEIQLMDVGLATSAQLQSFRDDDLAAGLSQRPIATWWMSATLQRTWFEISPDTTTLCEALPEYGLDEKDRKGSLWAAVEKPCRTVEMELERINDFADLVAEEHIKQGRGVKGPTLVVVNRVDRAIELFQRLRENRALAAKLEGVDLRLIHSRFRPLERATWRDEFLRREQSGPGTDRIIIATQVIEAGVDVSSGLLITDLAAWPSLVQRFGRTARWGGASAVIVVAPPEITDGGAAPYSARELEAARTALKKLKDVAPRSLEEFEAANKKLLPDLYPYDPTHLLLRHEVEELFDTAPDLSGADIDVSRFIRSGDERDVQLFWKPVPAGGNPAPEIRPLRDELCAAPFFRVRKWLCGPESKTSSPPRLKDSMRAWVWDWSDGRWRVAERKDLYPGQTVLVATDCGGYDPQLGWHEDSRTPVEALVREVLLRPDESADSVEDDESLSEYEWRTIATHGRETGALARRIVDSLKPELADLFDLAGRWHDAGKIHRAFSGSIDRTKSPFEDRMDLAKAPQTAWRRGEALYRLNGERRRGFRHELVSALALFSVLVRNDRYHEALLGPWQDFFSPTDDGRQTAANAGTDLEREVLRLNAKEFNLLAYLVCAHHGKVRVAWQSTRHDQAARSVQLRIHGVAEGDLSPSLPLYAQNADRPETLPEFKIELSLASAGLNANTGAGWTERVLDLLAEHGPFSLAWMESLLRAADIRASRSIIEVDPLLKAEAKR